MHSDQTDKYRKHLGEFMNKWFEKDWVCYSLLFLILILYCVGIGGPIVLIMKWMYDLGSYWIT
jgi:hypothetical protein